MFAVLRHVLSRNQIIRPQRLLTTSRTWFGSDKCIKELLSTQGHTQEHLTVRGWVKSVRTYKKVSFLQINDGSTYKNVQVVVSPELISSINSSVTVGASVEICGQLQPSHGKGQEVELKASTIELLGPCSAEEYPIKHRQTHSPEYMREVLHLRPRTRHFASLLRIRNVAAQAFHEYFQEEGYVQIHTPVITSNDCEGAGEVFAVEPYEKLPSDSGGEGGAHFFNIPAFLSVSGQLHLEACTGAFKKVYTFGPTFRAENSRGRHHLSEFYMIEGELAFIKTMEELIQAVEDLFRGVTRKVMDKAEEDIDWLCRYHDPEGTEWGKDLQKEHEQYLVKHCGDTPVFVVDFPANIKPFYARQNDDGKTAASLDLLCSDVGEICGGTMREERLNLIQDKLVAMGQENNYQWYTDLRKFGSVPHGGFGIGFERYLQSLLGILNIKDTLPFPRYSRNCRM